MLFYLIWRLPPRTPRTDTLLPYSTLCRSPLRPPDGLQRKGLTRPARAAFFFVRDQTTLSLTSTLLRVAFEYGQTSCALATSASASARARPGSDTASAIYSPNPPSERGPNPTVALTVVSSGPLAPPPNATNFIAPQQEADTPEPNSQPRKAQRR